MRIIWKIDFELTDEVKGKLDESRREIAAGKLRVGDHRVLYEFDAKLGRLYLHYVDHRREIYKRS